MADDEKKDEAAEGENAGEEEVKKSKKPLFLGGGIVGLIGAAYLMATMAVPDSPQEVPFQGPFSTPVQAEGEITVNLSGGGGAKFLVMSLIAEVYSYDEVYPTTRVADPLYSAILKDALISLSRQKTSDYLNDNQDIFIRELIETINPILFPVHVGDEVNPYAVHIDSGLKSGLSMAEGTYRVGFKKGKLAVNGPERTVQLDEGPVVEFAGFEQDLMVSDPDGRSVYLDVSLYEPEFVGEISIGAFGQTSRILLDKFIIQ